MKDVAGVAGVSLATVSRVLSETGEVRPDLAAKVRSAVEMLGYRRDVMASTLRRADRLSGSLGLVFEDVSNPFFSSVHRGIEELARERGVLALAGSSDDDPIRERRLADAFAARAVDGLVIVPCGNDQGYLARERDAGVALVFVDRPPRFIDADAVLSDNLGGTAGAVARLAASGHRRIAFLGDRRRVFTATERLTGYERGMREAGLPIDADLIRTELGDAGRAEAAAHDLLCRPGAPTALFAGQNLVTVGALRALRRLGLQHEVALIGFDDIPLADMLDPGVTVVAQDPVEIGRSAARLVFSRLDGYDGPTRRIIVETELRARGSGELAPPAP